MGENDRVAETGPASALRVIEASSGIAGAYCGWLLQRVGADVRRIELGPAPAGSDALSLARRYFGAAKPVATLGEASFSQIDIVITDDWRAFEAAAGRSLADLSAAFPDTVFGAASVFGLTGPLADAPAVPLDAQAVSSTAWALGEPGRAPLSIPPGVLDCQAGVHLAASSLMARWVGAGRGGAGVVDVALADILAAYVAVNCRFYIHHNMQWQRAGRRASNSGGAYPFVILPCADGDVCLSGRTRAEWERFVLAMGSPDWAKEPRYQKLRAMGQQYPEEVDALILPWLEHHSKADIEALANQFQLTIAPLRGFADILATPQLATRGFLRTFDDAGRDLLGPGLPFKVSQKRGPDAPDVAPSLLAQAGGKPRAPSPGRRLTGLRVLDLGWVWSAPQAGSILAQFGAEVIKVEHSQRLDNSRLSGTVFRNGQKIDGPATDMSPMFHQINKGKIGITLNMKEPEGVDLLRRLAANSDILLENMSAGTMERTGLGYDALRAINPRLIMVAMSGAGQFGPLSDMRTYAPAMSSFAGLEALVGYEAESPVGALNFAVGDPNSAVHALFAVFAALARRETTGAGCYIDLSQTEALIATLTPYLLQAQAEGAQPAPHGSAHPTMAPHGIYPASGADQWLTLAVADDPQWQALSRLAPPWAQDPRYATAAGRLAHRHDLDEAVASWTATQLRDTLVTSLRTAGIAASPVQDIDGLWADQQLAARGMMHPVDLPTLGKETLFRAPWSFSGFAADPGGRGPTLGEHNERVLKGILGLPDAEYQRLVDTGAIL